jgi:putative ubiquitin-RnfH superfamily antitoxin RatB of RatAB toxin-antitoxin module
MEKIADSDLINIEVSYAFPQDQLIIPLKLPLKTTVKQALEISDILNLIPEIDLKKQKFGIFGKICKFDTILRNRDRIEIYRPLIADPKEIRKQRAAEGKKLKKG